MVIIVALLLVLMMFGAMVAGAFFFLIRKSATSSPPVVYSPPPAIATPAPLPTIAPVPTSTATVAPTATKLYLVPVGSSPVIGKSDALVTLVEFGDFQCPYCKRAAPTIDKLRAEYGSDLRVVWKNNPLPFHVNAAPAAELALEARAEKGDAAFWKVHDELYAASSLDEASLEAIARSDGLNFVMARASILKNLHKREIDADQELARHVDASGTPSFFVNGRIVVGAQPITKFESVIEDALKDAKARVAGGTPRAGVYDAIMREAAAASP